jgi:ribosomal RNA assembly protein
MTENRLQKDKKEPSDNYGYFKENDDKISDSNILLSSSDIEGELSYDLKIPKDRVGVLIGKNGMIKRKLELDTECKIDVDSKEGEVFIFGTDGLKLFIAKNVILAIARGFNPETAITLLKPDYNFELIDLNDFARKEQHQRLKGRIIGSEGKSRKLIEDFTNTNICVYGKTVGIIGRVENVDIAKRACTSLLEGAAHASIYKWLEKKKREMKINEMIMPSTGIPKEAIKTEEDKKNARKKAKEKISKKKQNEKSKEN